MLRNTLLTAVLLFAVLIQPASSQDVFQVQLAAYAEPFANFKSFFANYGIENVEEVSDQNGLFRYVISGFDNRLAAESVLKKAKERGFEKAVVVDLEEQRALCGVPCPYFNGGVVFNDDANEGITVRTIRFDYGRYSLNAETKKELNEMAFILEHNRDYVLKILGHTDAAGDAATNMRVAAERARSARNYLIGKGISAERLFIKVYGESRPIVPNTDDKGQLIPENQKLNRRVVLAVIKKDETVVKDSELKAVPPNSK